MRGKSNQRAFAKLLKKIDPSVKNIGIAGAEDLLGDYVVVECKERQSLPKWLLHAFRQLREEEHKDKIHVVQIHLLRQRHLNDLILMTVKTFIRLLTAFVEFRRKQERGMIGSEGDSSRNDSGEEKGRRG